MKSRFSLVMVLVALLFGGFALFKFAGLAPRSTPVLKLSSFENPRDLVWNIHTRLAPLFLANKKLYICMDSKGSPLWLRLITSFDKHSFPSIDKIRFVEGGDCKALQSLEPQAAFAYFYEMIRDRALLESNQESLCQSVRGCAYFFRSRSYLSKKKVKGNWVAFLDKLSDSELILAVTIEP
jgi:hypothetical protein